MAGLKGNVATLLAAKQTGKGVVPTPTAANSYKMALTGGGMSPTRETDNLSETDASRDRGNTFVTVTGAEGSPAFYVRDKSIGFWLLAALGADAVTGTMPNFTHALTPANNLPYICLWSMLGDLLFQQFPDCKVGSLSIAAEAGQPLIATANVVGRSAQRLTTAIDNATPIAVDTGAVYNYNDATVTLGGGATALIGSFELTVENNVTTQQTDASSPYDVVEGLREISLGFDLIFESLDEYNKFHFGGAAGTTQDPTVGTTSALFTFTKSATNEVAFNLPVIAYEEFPVESDPGGDPVVVSVRAGAQRATPNLTATVKNQVATY